MKNVRGNAYPHWGLKRRDLEHPNPIVAVRGNAYPHWGLKHMSLQEMKYPIYSFEVMPIPIGD